MILLLPNFKKAPIHHQSAIPNPSRFRLLPHRHISFIQSILTWLFSLCQFDRNVLKITLLIVANCAIPISRINFRFIPSKEAMACVNGKEQSFFFQIVAAREDFNRWLNVIIPTSVFTYAAVYQKFISSFISSRPGCPEGLCMESREVSLRCP